MLLIRRFEERAAQAYGQGLIGGFCHLYIGQEAVIAGTYLAAQTTTDTFITTYRDHGHMLACDISADIIMAELFGKVDGISKGKGGSMHMFSTEKKFYGGHGIVGASAPLGTGLALAHKYKRDQGVCLTYYGDGAANQGQVFEAMNMAVLMRLPVLYIIENNGYSMGTSVARGCAGGSLHKRGSIFGIESSCVNGMNFLEVYNAAKSALDYVRNNSMPYILEMQTYRYRGHSMSDPGKYRSKDEVETYKQLDPITQLATHLSVEFKVSEADLETYDEEATRIALASLEFAKNSALPSADELYTDVYV